MTDSDGESDSTTATVTVNDGNKGKKIHITYLNYNQSQFTFPVSRKSRKRFGPEKSFVNLPTACKGTPIF